MAYKQGESRYQLTIMPMCLDDYIGANSVCRLIAVYVERLDMAALGFKYAEAKSTGCPPYDPAKMLDLYLYGYMNRVRSSRRLEAETHRNVEVMWLMEKLTPDDKTICNFRKDNTTALKKVFREFSLWCNQQGLYGKELVGVDGTKVRANSSRKNIHTQKGTEKALASVEKQISEYMNDLEANDAVEADDARMSPEAIREALKRLNNRKDTLNDWLKKIEENGGKEISTVDPDARMMHSGGDARPLDACYNVQMVVDSKNKLIVDFEVSICPDDKGALPMMTASAKEIMGAENISAVADKGYYDGEDIEKSEKNGITCLVPAVGSHAPAPDKMYDQKHFKYSAEKDCYICPEGKELPFRQLQKRKDDKFTNRVYYDTKACRDCPNREKCTTNKRGGRHISRNPYQDVLDINNARMLTDKGRETFRERKKIVEHPYGTTKAVWGYKQFLCKGQEKATAEQSLTFLAYNFRRVISIFKENGNNLISAMV